jgi:ribonuclease P protein component
VPDQETFPRNERLSRKDEFQHAYREGEKCVHEAFVCYVVRRAGQGRKLGCAVSRKVGGAVVRNRVKRYIREFYRAHRGRIPDDVHLVVVARAASAGLSCGECAEAMRETLRKGAVLRG